MNGHVAVVAVTGRRSGVGRESIADALGCAGTVAVAITIRPVVVTGLRVLVVEIAIAVIVVGGAAGFDSRWIDSGAGFVTIPVLTDRINGRSRAQTTGFTKTEAITVGSAKIGAVVVDIVVITIAVVIVGGCTRFSSAWIDLISVVVAVQLVGVGRDRNDPAG